MALNSEYLNYIETAIAENFPLENSGLVMLELGDQIINDPLVKEKTGKEYFKSRNITHVSVDFNGLHGSLMLDLRRPEQFQKFHNITNSGTTEHVDPKDTQYECFNILHDCLKLGGIMVHIVPDFEELKNFGAWKYHCNNYYTIKFFEMLAVECAYELSTATVINHNRCVVLRKTERSVFMQDREKFLALISYQPIPLFIKVKEKIGAILRSLHLRK